MKGAQIRLAPDLALRIFRHKALDNSLWGGVESNLCLDPRFFEDLGPVTLIELAALTGRPSWRMRRTASGAFSPCRARWSGRLARPDASFFSDKRYPRTT